MEYYHRYALCKTALFSGFLKCVTLAGPRPMLAKTFIYDTAERIADWYISKAIKEDYDVEAQLPENGAFRCHHFPGEAAFELVHWLMGIEERPAWIPSDFHREKDELQFKVKNKLQFYEAYEHSQIKIP
jgi:hypothetical protein